MTRSESRSARDPSAGGHTPLEPRPRLRVGGLARHTHAEGPGLRAAVWVQGCSLGCAGCCNPELWDAAGGRVVEVASLAADLVATPGIEGVTVLGGEPLQQLPAVAALARHCAAAGRGVIVFTGYTPDEARARPGFSALWSALDTLVAGPYDARRPEPAHGRAVVGSHNQVLLHRTERYADPAHWQGPRRVEAHIDLDGSVRLVGAPALVARVRRRLRTPCSPDPSRPSSPGA